MWRIHWVERGVRRQPVEEDIVNGISFSGCWCDECTAYRKVHMSPEDYRRGLQAFRWRRHRQKIQEDAYRRRVIAADQRARALLREHLTPEQVKTYENYGYFDEFVVAEMSDDDFLPLPLPYPRQRRYVYRLGAYSVQELSPQQRNWCIVANGVGIPDHDLYLAQLLWIRHNHAGFRDVAIPSQY
jgi:hypothetical protein